MSIIAVIEGEQITYASGVVFYRAKAAIDTDGIGPLHGDPDAQRQTSLQHNGKSLNADVDKYIVVPPVVIQSVAGVVLGCQAYVENLRTGRKSPAVVGDIGPRHKLGEISVAVAKELGINPSPTTGGVDQHVIHYTIYPGMPANFDGVTYALQPYVSHTA